MDVLWIFLGVVCLLLGIVGCFLPFLPGPPLAYIGMLFLHFTERVQYSMSQLLIWLVIVVVLQILDYVIPTLGSKYSGGSKWGTWGCVIGTVLGLFFLPYGVIVGPFLGAVMGELLGRRGIADALKSGFGSLLGFLFGTILKFAVCFYFICQFVISLVEKGG